MRLRLPVQYFSSSVEKVSTTHTFCVLTKKKEKNTCHCNSRVHFDKMRRLKIPPYSSHSFGSSFENVSFDSWCKGGLCMGFDPIMVDLACSIVEAVSSSVGLETYFLTMGLTYGRLRSSRGIEKAGKRSFLFRLILTHFFTILHIQIRNLHVKL